MAIDPRPTRVPGPGGEARTGCLLIIETIIITSESGAAGGLPARGAGDPTSGTADQRRLKGVTMRSIALRRPAAALLLAVAAAVAATVAAACSGSAKIGR